MSTIGVIVKDFWQRLFARKPWIFRDRFGLAYLFTAQDTSAPRHGQGEVMDNPALLAYLQAQLKSGQVFVDLSPDVGGVALLAARHVHDTGSVYAFAADPGDYRQLVNNAALNGLTGCVRVIGRPVLAADPAYTLDTFATAWKWRTVDYLRLKSAAQWSALQTSAAGLLQAGRIRQLLFDDVEPATLTVILPALKQLGFVVESITAAGTLQPLPQPAARTNIVAHRQ